MDMDLFFIIGLVIGVLAIPSVLSALLEGRVPRVASIVLIAGGGMVAYAVSQTPTGYAISDIPDVFVRVVARYFN